MNRARRVLDFYERLRLGTTVFDERVRLGVL